MIRKNSILFILLSITLNANVFGFNNLFTEILSAKPGSKSKEVLIYENKDIETLKKRNRCPQHYRMGEPMINNEKINENSLFLCKTTFAMQFDSINKIPLWTIEELSKENYNIPPMKYDFRYHEDKELPSSFQLKPQDFFENKLFPLHLVNPKHISINKRELKPRELINYNLSAIYENYTFSNIIPVNFEDFYKTIWSDLENFIFSKVKKNLKSTVITGVIYANGKDNGTLPYSKTKLPTHFYKIYVGGGNNGSISFIIPNKKIYTKKTKLDVNLKEYYTCKGKPCSLENFIVRIDEIEKHANIKFFKGLNEEALYKLKNNKELPKSNINKSPNNKRWEEIIAEQEKIEKIKLEEQKKLEESYKNRENK